MIKEKVSIRGDVDFNKIKSSFINQNISFNEEDGLKIIWKNKWVHIRKSNTEPIIRIISEALDNETATELIDSIKHIIN